MRCFRLPSRRFHHYGDGTNADLMEANIVAMGHHRYPHWWQFMTRRKLRRIAAIVRGVCDEFGWGAYVRAIEERKEEEEERFRA